MPPIWVTASAATWSADRRVPVVLGVLGEVIGQVERTGWHARGFRMAGYGSQPGGVAGKVRGPWAACASERYAALGVAVEALGLWQLGDRQRQQRGLPSWVAAS